MIMECLTSATTSSRNPSTSMKDLFEIRKYEAHEPKSRSMTESDVESIMVLYGSKSIPSTRGKRPEAFNHFKKSIRWACKKCGEKMTGGSTTKRWKKQFHMDVVKEVLILCPHMLDHVHEDYVGEMVKTYTTRFLRNQRHRVKKLIASSTVPDAMEEDPTDSTPTPVAMVLVPPPVPMPPIPIEPTATTPVTPVQPQQQAEYKTPSEEVATSRGGDMVNVLLDAKGKKKKEVAVASRIKMENAAVADQETHQSSTTAKENNAALLLGKWYNELGSMMDILKINKEGHLTGYYQTAVGRQTGKKFDLVGDLSTTQENPTFGMTVVWKDSTTCWVGQYYEIDDKPTLLTTWMLRNNVSVENDWESTLTNKDTFTRVPQS